MAANDSVALESQLARQLSYRTEMGMAWLEVDLVFATRTGRPVEPRNLVRSFRRICDDNNVRAIAVHHVRHTIGSLHKALSVPARDAQIGGSDSPDRAPNYHGPMKP